MVIGLKCITIRNPVYATPIHLGYLWALDLLVLSLIVSQIFQWIYVTLGSCFTQRKRTGKAKACRNFSLLLSHSKIKSRKRDNSSYTNKNIYQIWKTKKAYLQSHCLHGMTQIHGFIHCFETYVSYFLQDKLSCAWLSKCAIKVSAQTTVYIEWGMMLHFFVYLRIQMFMEV